MIVQKTSNYDLFKMRSDNRLNGINQDHVDKLKQSIALKNMLDLRPISVNSDMEVLDGQHRLAAAKQLGLEIYYVVTQDMTPKDMILLNTNKSWGIADFYNFYLKHNYPEYLKLQEFIKKYNIPLHVAVALINGSAHSKSMEFRLGKFKFNNELIGSEVDDCWNTISYIKKMNGTSTTRYTESIKFWNALVKLVKHADFEAERWFKMLPKFIERIGARPTTRDYIKMLLEVFNYKSHNKIEI